MKTSIHVIKSVNRTSGVPESFQFELSSLPINNITKIELLECNLPTHVTKYFYIKILEIGGTVISHGTYTDYSTFIIPHHHQAVPGSNTEYTQKKSFDQILFLDRLNLNLINIKICDDTSQPIAGYGEWSMLLRITQS